MPDPLMTLEGAKNILGNTASEAELTLFVDAMNEIGDNLAKVFTAEELPNNDRAAYLEQEEAGVIAYTNAMADPRKVLYDAQQSWAYAQRSLVNATSFLRGVLYAGRAGGNSDSELALLTGLEPATVRLFLEPDSFI